MLADRALVGVIARQFDVLKTVERAMKFPRSARALGAILSLCSTVGWAGRPAATEEIDRAGEGEFRARGASGR